MPIIDKLAHNHQQNIQKQVNKSDALCFFGLLNNAELHEKLTYLLPEYRERHYSPTKTLSMFLAQAMSADHSCQKVVNDAAVKNLVSNGSPSTSVNTGAYCRARSRLPATMMSELTRYAGERVCANVPQKWLWHGKRVCLVDGTTVSLPDTPENQAIYPQPGGQKEGLGFPICRIVGITCLASGAILNAAYTKTKGKGSTEQTLIRKISHTLQLWKSWFSIGVNSCLENIQVLFQLIAGKTVGNRPGRVEPRAVKRRPKPMHLLNKKRAEARRDILKNGHPQKLK